MGRRVRGHWVVGYGAIITKPLLDGAGIYLGVGDSEPDIPLGPRMIGELIKLGL